MKALESFTTAPVHGRPFEWTVPNSAAIARRIDPGTIRNQDAPNQAALANRIDAFWAQQIQQERAARAAAEATTRTLLAQTIGPLQTQTNQQVPAQDADIHNLTDLEDLSDLSSESEEAPNQTE